MDVVVPAWVVDLDSFRRWTDTKGFPESGRISYLEEDVWVDMSEEQVFAHALVKSEIGFGLTGVAKAGQLGMYIVDGVRLFNAEADISCVPDGVFISTANLKTKAV